MKLALKGTPRVVVATLFRVAIDVAMTDVERRMLALSMRCQEKAARS